MAINPTEICGTTPHRNIHLMPQRTRRGAIGLLLGATTLLGLATSVPAAPDEALDGIVAVVNDDVIVRSELEREIALIVPQMQRQGTALPPPPQLEKQVLDRLILKHVQQQRANQLGIEVTDETLERALENIAQRNGLAVDELRETLEAGGVRFADFRKDTRAQIRNARLAKQEVESKVDVSEREIDAFLARESSRLIKREKVRLQHILVEVSENADAATIEKARSKIDRLSHELRRGADFGALAARASNGRQALNGGDLGWFEMGAVPSLVAELAYTLNQGEVSRPLRSPSGFHLIRLMDIQGAAPQEVSQTHAHHILIRTNETLNDADAKRRLILLRQRIQGGTSFETLARAHSNDQASAVKGGDLGWISPGDTMPEFEKAMDALAPGELSQPFKSAFGWHIVRVDERRQQSGNQEIMRVKAREALLRRKADEATEAWLRQLRDQAYIDIRLERS